MTPQEVWQVYCGKQPVIDIGCGWHIVFSFDYVRFDKASQILSQKTCVNHYGDFHDMSNFADNTFAFVNATHVIEHAEFPERALSEWLRILQAGGVINLTWPDLDVGDRGKIEELKKAVDRGDLETYRALGGDLAWVSLDKDGKKMLDVHYNRITLNDMKKYLGEKVVVLAEGIEFLIARKVY